MICPRCEQALQEKTYERVTIDRCGKCHGVWLDDGEIASIVEIEEEEFPPELVRKVIESAFAGIPTAVAAEAPEAKCPKCAKTMRLLNYGYDSGVIIDRCIESHGVWLDAGEIEKVQAFREQWEREAPKQREEWVTLLKTVRANPVAAEITKRTEHTTFMFRKFFSILLK